MRRYKIEFEITRECKYWTAKTLKNEIIPALEQHIGGAGDFKITLIPPKRDKKV